ncbi:MAG: ThuA domain-containing protein [Pirellulales bacterium]
MMNRATAIVRMLTRLPLLLMAMATVALGSTARAEDPWVVYPGGHGPGAGKHVVLISGDEEYRSEEALPMLAKILAVRHGFRCTVLFSINPKDGTIDPNNQANLPGLELLDTADMMVIATRFRELPDDQMAHIDRFVHSGKPILGLRTATHAFFYRRNKASRYAKYDFRSEEWPGGFGQQVLGDTWISHHGHHGHESTRGVINQQYAEHPILRGVQDVWGPTDVYTIKNLPEDAQILVHGQVLSGMKPTDPPNRDKPMMPLVWLRHFAGGSAKPSRVICTTMGASVDLESEGLRRLLVNACYWGLEMEDQIPATSNVAYVDPYDPSFFGSNGFKRGVRPADYASP